MSPSIRVSVDLPEEALCFPWGCVFDLQLALLRHSSYLFNAQFISMLSLYRN